MRSRNGSGAMAGADTKVLSELVSGRWHCEAMTEGHLFGAFPSTTRFAGGPPPRDKLGEDLS